ncbi:Fe2+-enterobactin ABC transporter substrate-binding protein [Rhodococcus rhodnii]|uniref:Iron-enterobactin transporter periplasmic binding protein n=2 Tax=Rhodococcus rhodnii TaxID=38312 RepID=R7WIQ0_9NOCA|nr:Fe2+-enterobactin ABC transporter substrate-binding protein [Rhodococcus rhodnii]EOM75117.1 iron-enterobactin transporter periplasmic binding protein [Rhodococcus rhodnii LMG 5362]TXG89396.1 Fe2+-enterobactin ABC transporter substrate-binding protein [Rhodococcus rhodnii]
MFRRSTVAAAAALAATALVLTGCSSGDTASESAPDATAETATGAWPRTVADDRGEVTIDAEPQRIVSTSVTLTGPLLALDAPLVGTGAQAPSTVTDDRGLFRQWADVATERDVDVLYQGMPDVESVTAAEPDLIFVSATGADSAADRVEVLEKIAPVVVLRYDDKSWQEITSIVAEAIGKEDAAQELVAEYDAHVASAREQLGDISAADPVNVLTYNSPNESKIFTAGSAQGQLFESLGFEIATLPDDIAGAGSGTGQERTDIVSVGQENLDRALPGDATFVVNAEQEDAERLSADPTLASTPAVAADRVYPLGPESFRLDYYSASVTIDHIVAELADRQ